MGFGEGSSRAGTAQPDVDNVVACLREAAEGARNERELEHRAGWCIEEQILKPLGLSWDVKYEYRLVSGRRLDALYGHVYIEFKAPGKLSTERGINRAKEQVVENIKRLAPSEEEWSKYLGVILSDKIAFVRYSPREVHKPPEDRWLLMGPYDIDGQTVTRLAEALRGLKRKALDADELVKEFGLESALARRTIKALYLRLRSSLGEGPKRKTGLLFEDWKRLFKQATGYEAGKLGELQELARKCEIPGTVDRDSLLFSVHTYYALVMKLLAAELAYLYGSGRFLRSYADELVDAYSGGGVEGLKESLRELESGGKFRDLLGIENFLEGDYFSWYVDELDGALADCIAEIARRLSEYEPPTTQLGPEFARDLLKGLYQDLVPPGVRRKLGEYYTPDWLADLVLDELGLSLEDLRRMGKEDPLKPFKIRVLDPACGSGTFLVRYIERLKRYAEERYLTDELAKYVLENVVGYDLNPLAVLAARTNYLLAAIDLIARVRGAREIPVYLTDSTMIEGRASVVLKEKEHLSGSEERQTIETLVYLLRTAAGEFPIPKSIVERGLLSGVLKEIASCLKVFGPPRNETEKEVGEKIKKEVEAFKGLLRTRFGGKIGDPDLPVLVRLYEALLELKARQKDNVWVPVIRNAFAPLFKGKFDYVVGNPPWVNWENLPESYRRVSEDLWLKYGLLGKGTGFKRDLAMLFLARCFDLYLKEGGKLGFLMPFTVFKSQAGAGFRRFLVYNTRAHIVHDLVTLYPFEGAVNRVSMVVVEKVCELGGCGDPDRRRRLEDAIGENRRGIKHVIWVSKTGRPVPTDMPLEDVLKIAERFDAVMVSIDRADPGSPWMQVTPKSRKAVEKVIGESVYVAHEGAHPALNQVYFIKILGKLPDGRLVITNPPESGQKKKVKQVETAIEPDFVYPLIRGKDVKKWYVSSENRYIILPHKEDGRPLHESDLKLRFPNTYAYLYSFRDELVWRAIKPFLSIQKRIREIREQMGKSKEVDKLKEEMNRLIEELYQRFYIVDNVGDYTFAPYKVVWKRIAGAITGKAVSFACAVVGPDESGKPVIPDDSTILVPFQSPDEAYYLSGILNSSIARAIVASYTYELRQETHVLENVRVPRFDPRNPVHRRIAELSRRAHELAKLVHSGKDGSARSELERIEDELDRTVAQLYGITDEELAELRRLLRILGGEAEAEEAEEEVEPPEG